MVSGSTGERIAAYRHRRGLSQAALAGLVGRSESWLSQVERGVRGLDRLSTILEIAKVLRVDVEALTGQPWQDASNGDTSALDLNFVRIQLASYDGLVEPASTATGLNASAAKAHAMYQAARYSHLIDGLPTLLSEADSLRSFGGRSPDLSAAYVSAYVAAAKLLTKVGAGDLALIAADRSAGVASENGSAELRGIAAYQVVCALRRVDRSDEAERLAVRMATQLLAGQRLDDPGVLSVAGSLWLIGAVIAAGRADRGEALQRLASAGSLAEELGTDANYGWTAFGPTNVAIHRVSVAAELGDAQEAISAASDVDPMSLPLTLSSRRVRIHLDLAWAYARRKRDAEATLHLLEAERVAPQTIRYHAMARDVLKGMLGRSRRTRLTALLELAQRSGIVG